MHKAYAGIGSRHTPPDICDFMEKVATALEKKGYILRSGGANGADVAFEAGVKDVKNKEIFLPWPKFNQSVDGIVPSDIQMMRAYALAEAYHPAWERCSDAAKKLIARNGFQILGLKLENPSDFVICWTSDGKASGGTGQAIRIAKGRNIPVYNLRSPKNIKKVASLCLL